MSNAWKVLKPTFATMSWTDTSRRGTSVRRLPITGKHQHIRPGISNGVDGKCCAELCQALTSAVSPTAT